MKHLVILGSSITALAVARDAQAHGLRPFVIDSEAGPASKSRWVQFVSAPPPTEAGSTLRILEHGTPDSALIATGDHWLRLLVKDRERFDAAFGSVLHPASPILKILLSKGAFSSWCAASGLPSPRAWMPGDEARPADLSFPLLIRPAETLHAQRDLGLPKAVEAQDEETLQAWLTRFRHCGVQVIVAESLLQRDLIQYSVPLARSGSRMLSFVARKIRPEPRYCSVGTCVEVVENAVIEQLGRQAAERADYFGIGEVEVLHDQSTGLSYVIEINARPWLQYALAPASGHDFLGLLLGAATGDSGSRNGNRVWLNLQDDLFAAFSRSVGCVRQGRLGALQYLRSVARANVFALFDLRDPKPFIGSLRLPGLR